MQTALIVTTYNWPEALHLTLASVAAQSRMPDLIVVADDGSGPATRAVVDSWSAAGLPIRHVWQEDSGFRLARARNRAIVAAAGADYILLVDGDMLLHPRFVADHVSCARDEWFIQGARLQLSPAATARILQTGRAAPGPFTHGLRRRAYALRSPLLSRLFSQTKATLGGIQGCNQSFWRRHALEVNGYDERFNAWGPEDREFAARLLHRGIQRRYVRHMAIAFHLHHTTRAPSRDNSLDGLLEATLASRAVWTEYGISLSPTLPRPAGEGKTI